MIVVEPKWFHHLFCRIRPGIILSKTRQQLSSLLGIRNQPVSCNNSFKVLASAKKFSSESSAVNSKI